MIGQLWGMARNDLAVWLRSPAAIAAALLPALGMGLLVAMLTNSVGQQPVALVVQGKGRLAARMANIIRGDAEAYLLTDMAAADAERAIGEQRVAAIIVIPENFDQAVTARERRGRPLSQQYRHRSLPMTFAAASRAPWPNLMRPNSACWESCTAQPKLFCCPIPIALPWPSTTCVRPTCPSCNIR